MARTSNTGSPEKQSGVASNRVTGGEGSGGKSLIARDIESICPSIDNVRSIDQLKLFMSLLCDKQATDLATAIRSSVDVFEYCIPAREAVLTFYSDLFSEYNTRYWILKKRSHLPTSTTSDKLQVKANIDYVGELTRRFLDMEKLKLADAREDQMSDSDVSPKAIMRPSSPKSIASTQLTGPDSPTASGSHTSPVSSPTKVIPTVTKKIPTSRRTSSCHSNDEDEQTPMSPSAQDGEAMQDDDVECIGGAETIDIFLEIEKQICLIRSTFDNLFKKYGLKGSPNITSVEENQSTICSFSRQRSRFKNTITRWASEFLLQSSAKYADVSIMIANDLSKANQLTELAKLIELWVQNPVNKLLIDLILDSCFDVRQLFDRLVAVNQNCDWLLAYSLLELSKRPDHEKNFNLCMEYIIGGTCNTNSITSILAYLSDNNPKAMTNFPKSNIPLLISQCQASKSLLNVLALELPDQINPEFLNYLAKEVFRKIPSQNHPTCIEGIKHCIVAAPNSYKLYLLSMDVMLDEKISVDVKSVTKIIIDKILQQIQQRTMTRLPVSNVVISNPDVQIVDGLLNQISSDPRQLIYKYMTSKFVTKKTRTVFHLMSLLYGNLFASKIIGHYLNLPEEHSWPLLKPLLNQFMKNFGDDGSTIVSQTLSLEADLRTAQYWDNLLNLTVAIPALKLDLDLISQLLVDKLCATILDVQSTAHLIKLCCSSLERVDHSRIRIGTKHKLCMSLATCFFLLLDTKDENFPQILSYIRVSLTCMSLLKQSTVASHILCRALLERCLVYGHLFNENFNPDLIGARLESSDWTQDHAIKLSKENLKVSLGHRFRRLPNHKIERETMINGNSERIQKSSEQVGDADTPNRQAINSYLLIEAFKSSINNIDAFANLFVEFHCPVMFDKHLWPSDEALRVINEKNLSILRRFEQVPPFWDLFELIGQAKCLKNCIVLVKALLAAHLAMWASATAKSCPDKMMPTTRLIPPLAHSGLIPKAFASTVEVFPHLSPSEVFAVLSDIWQYLKDTNAHNSDTEDLPPDEYRLRTKNYLNKLRLFMCQHMPGPTYVKIFKEFYQPAPKTIPT